MTTRMEKLESGASKRSRQRRHFEERIRQTLGLGLCDAVFLTPDMASISTRDRVTADLAAVFLKQSGFRDVTVEPHVSQEGVWTACGLVH